MAIESSAKFDIDPLTYGVTMSDDDGCKSFTDQYFLSFALLSPDSLSPPAYGVDEFLQQLPIADYALEHYSFSHNSTSRDSIADEITGDGGCSLLPYSTPASLSPDVLLHAPSCEPVRTYSTSAKSVSKPRRQPIPKTSEPSRMKTTESSKAKNKTKPAKRKRRTITMERNRVAASKLRLRNKSAVDALGNVCNELEQKNIALKTDHDSLLKKVLELKNQILMHATCGDEGIDAWVMAEARSYVEIARC